MFVPHTTRAWSPVVLGFGTCVSIHLLCPHFCCFVLSRPAFPQNPGYFRIFPISMSHISLFSCPTNQLPRKVFLSGKLYLGMRGRIDKKILFRYLYLHLQNRAYYTGTPPASNILKFYSNNGANTNIYSLYRQVSPRFPTYYPLSHDSWHLNSRRPRSPRGPTSLLSRFPQTPQSPFPIVPNETILCILYMSAWAKGLGMGSVDVTWKAATRSVMRGLGFLGLAKPQTHLRGIRFARVCETLNTPESW